MPAGVRFRERAWARLRRADDDTAAHGQHVAPGALARPDASRHLLALCRCVDALGRCGVDTGAARVHAWVDDAMSGTRDAPVAHLVAVEALGPADDDALAAALSQGPMLVYHAVEAE